MNAKKIILAVGVVGLFIGYALFAHNNGKNKTLPPLVASTPNATLTQPQSSEISNAPLSGTSSPTGSTPPPSESAPQQPVFQNNQQAQPSQPVPAPSVAIQQPATSTKKQTKGQYADGTYTGSVADAFYGSLQVQAKITDGKISDVLFLQYPNDRSTSIQINTSAMPVLKSEAIQAQNAKVDAVSGATQTSQAFVETLGVALAKASQ